MHFNISSFCSLRPFGRAVSAPENCPSENAGELSRRPRNGAVQRLINVDVKQALQALEFQ
jgi:hypothetical protein